MNVNISLIFKKDISM